MEETKRRKNIIAERSKEVKKEMEEGKETNSQKRS
jgi:hypothetical protein